MMYYAEKNNSYFTREEALERIKEMIEGGYDGYYCDLHNEVFNMDYYIIDRTEAENALAEYGTFKAIGAVVSYEKDYFGEINTDITKPENVANMLWWIIGAEAIAEIEGVNGDNWNEVATEESNEEILAEINKILG